MLRIDQLRFPIRKKYIFVNENKKVSELIRSFALIRKGYWQRHAVRIMSIDKIL